MIEITKLSKSFDGVQALADVSFNVSGGIFGLVGTNGAGKSTLARILAGVCRPDAGRVLIDGAEVYENPACKQNLFYVSDDAFCFPNACMADMAAYYKLLYPGFSDAVFQSLTSALELPAKRRLSTFSKGMARQALLILGFASQAKYLLLDETFDGLDPVMRQSVKRFLAAGVSERGLTAVIASHSLRELEDIADRVGLLHRGDLVLDMDVEHIQTGMHKVQCAFAGEAQRAWFDSLRLLSFETRSRLCTLVAEAEPEAILAAVNAHDAQFVEVIPLTLEELFISKMEGIGYEIKDVLV